MLISTIETQPRSTVDELASLLVVGRQLSQLPRADFAARATGKERLCKRLGLSVLAVIELASGSRHGPSEAARAVTPGRVEEVGAGVLEAARQLSVYAYG